ncbi:hypothetical protein ACFX2J_044649 [Malus domestica]|uniref:Uncharacterized protein n=1 Tax=Malus domestica TaxID=3750 RepID=A0A498J7G2_MALDO|nr:hypothetical protein DVH24_031708 [Malus domestica]
MVLFVNYLRDHLYNLLFCCCSFSSSPFRAHQLKFSYLPSSFHRRPTCKSKPPTKPSHPSSSSKKGFDLLKDLLVTQAVSFIIPHQLPKISKSKRIRFLGNVNVVLSNVTIYEIDVGPSHFELGDDGIAVIDSGVTCNLNMNCQYYDSTWIAPVVVSDEGRASIQFSMSWNCREHSRTKMQFIALKITLDSIAKFSATKPEI